MFSRQRTGAKPQQKYIFFMDPQEHRTKNFAYRQLTTPSKTDSTSGKLRNEKVKTRQNRSKKFEMEQVKNLFLIFAPH